MLSNYLKLQLLDLIECPSCRANPRLLVNFKPISFQTNLFLFNSLNFTRLGQPSLRLTHQCLKCFLYFFLSQFLKFFSHNMVIKKILHAINEFLFTIGVSLQCFFFLGLNEKFYLLFSFLDSLELDFRLWMDLLRHQEVFQVILGE